MPRLFKRDGIWYAWVPRSGGGTRKVTTNCTDRKAAEKRAGELEREAVDPTYAAAGKATVRAACDEFLASRARRGRAEGTLHHYRTKLGHIVRLLPSRLADIVDTGPFERFIEQRLDEGAAPTTISKERRAFGAMLNHARRAGLFLRDPKSVIPEFEETYKPRERFLAPLELVALVNALPPARAAHVVYIVATGARWGESVRARYEEDVKDGAMVHLRGTKTKTARRTVPVPPTMRIALAWALANAPPERFDAWTNVGRDLASVCERIGVARVTPNDLRRTFAMWLRRSGVTPDIIGAALGHTTSRMAELVYGRISPEDLDRLITERGPALLMPPAASDLERTAERRNLRSKTGLLMGAADVGSESSGVPLGRLPDGWPRTELNRRHGDFQSPALPTELLGRDVVPVEERLFNPSGIAANVDESDDSSPGRAANGLTFRARARRWLMRAA